MRALKVLLNMILSITSRTYLVHQNKEEVRGSEGCAEGWSEATA